jgi:membrane-bound serine protease (ClpP class)
MEAFMAFLLDPNLVYILIVAAFLLTVFAVLIPGTGMFEIAALIVWGVVLWLAYNIEIHIWALVLLLLGFIPLVLALRRRQVTRYLVMAMAAFMIGSAYLFKADAWWKPGVHPLLAVVMSVFAGGLVWLVLDRLIDVMDAPPVHDLNVVIGAVGETRTRVHHEGSVYVGGEKWSARSEKPLKTGTMVKVVDRDGLVLIVKEIKE